VDSETLQDQSRVHHHHHHQQYNPVSTPGGNQSVDDPNTTNIFISNLSPKTNEQELMQRFGHYGLLASVKIMWPRSDDDKARNANCGFVAYMNRRDAEQGLAELDGTSINGQTLRLSWYLSCFIFIFSFIKL